MIRADFRGHLKARPSSRPGVTWKQSFAVRFAVVWALVLGGAVGVSGWLAHRDTRHQLLGSLRETVEQDARVMELRLETWLRTLGEDVRAASRSPMVEEFLETRGTVDEGRWRALVEDGFGAVFAGKPTYIQMRLLELGGANEGREILRLDRRGEELVVTPREQLQEKGGRSYFQEALSLPEEEVYFSEINLNRDFGEITSPYLPTIRAAIKIGTVPGRQMMLIINADLRLLFAELENLASPGSEIYLADEKGDFLMHPDEGATFASDLGHAVRFTDGGENGDLSEERRIPAGQWPRRSLMVRVALRDTAWRPQVEQSRWRGIWTTVIASLAGAGVALLIAWPFTRRLGRLAKALRRFDGKEELDAVALADAGQDEIGVAIQRFQEMAIKVGDHVEELQRAREDAEAAEAAKEKFLAVMSHEIRTPMNAVVGLIRVLEENDPLARQEPILRSLRSSTDNLMTLLNTALDYTRLQEGVIRYEAVDFDAAAVAREVIAALRALAMGRSLALELEAPVALTVRGDPVRLRQVMNNLLNNAIKFTGEGFVKLSLEWADDELQGRVMDTGPGIREEDRERIFSPFFSRVAGSDSTAPGAGLGLSVSREMIVQQGGSLELECPAAGGAEFVFRLPYPRTTERLPVEGGGESAGWTFERNLRVLYAEDTPSNQEVMRLTLEGTGIGLSCAGTAGEALEIFKGGAFDLVMVDLQLPDRSGAELAGEIRRLSSGCPVIAVTAQSSAKTDDEVSAAGIGEVILKPYSKEEVLRVLARFCSPDLSGALGEIHPGDGVKAGKLAGLMAREFREAAEELRQVARVKGSGGELAKTCGAIRHRLVTALARFPLRRVDVAFERLTDTEGGVDPARIDEVLAALDEAADRMGGLA
ncbi:MAG: ATP-binding protein [Akkermansiaceae bacterium]